MGPEQGAADLDEILAQVQALMTEKPFCRTPTIDPLTVPYNNACDSSATQVGTDYGRHKIEAGPEDQAPLLHAHAPAHERHHHRPIRRIMGDGQRGARLRRPSTVTPSSTTSLT
jgi:hypothetical protein